MDGRWNTEVVDSITKIALAKCVEYNFRLQCGASLGYLRRWFGILGIALQKEVVQLGRVTTLEDPCFLMCFMCAVVCFLQLLAVC